MPPKKRSGAKAGGANKSAPPIPDSDHIVFTNDQGPGKKQVGKDEVPGPPRPDARTIIGGASWTGKLPMTLLSELCQKQKWNKPDYSMRKMPGDAEVFRSSVKLSKSDPKTKEITTLPPFQLPASHVHLSDQPTALEARHFAAAYALFRVSSMKNIHMMLPPQYRDLWKGQFMEMKQEDVRESRAWKYDADPFAAEAERQRIHKEMEKQRDEKAKKVAQAAASPSVILPHRNATASRMWDRVPTVEMGQQVRAEIEEVVREKTIWNPYGVRPSPSEQAAVLKDLTALGFRRSHVDEAVQYCKDREESVEWLSIHVPEDDLPAWCLPPGYSAGISLASGDLVKEAKLKRLALGGYSADDCKKMLREHNDDELRAAQALQDSLMQVERKDAPNTPAESSSTWDDEMTTLPAIFDDRFSQQDQQMCTIRADTIEGKVLSLHFRRPLEGYPISNVPIIAIKMDDTPAYIRLSATRKTIVYAQENLLGDSMIYGLVEWLETNWAQIEQNPGSLLDLQTFPKPKKASADAGHLGQVNGPNMARKRPGSKTKINPPSNQALYDAWAVRQKIDAQQRMIKARQSLPAWSKQDAIVEAVKQYQCVIISGETGSGKSTQSVQFVLDHLISTLKGSSVNIICTQPRRISALGLSERVSNERCSTEGDEVGYIIRGDSRVSAKTKITFMTTGVLLRRLQTSGDMLAALSDISHIFIDEVHERSLDTDFLLALVRDVLKARKDIRLILMSATLDAKIFSDYLGGPEKVGHVHIEGRTFPVQDYYLDDVVKMTNGTAETWVEGDDEDVDTSTGRAVRNLGMGINYALITDLVRHIDEKLRQKTGGILIFLPGTFEIDRCIRSLNEVPGLYCLPLHASLLPAEQRRVFPPAPHGKRKVIAATNVAETSITIEDIVAVIDSGRVKETNYDPVDNMVRLQEVWASKAACKQRRGRAGRVQAGVCYKLFTRNVEANAPERPEPEIRRVPLEQLCLSVKATGSDRDVALFLAETLTPPESSAVSGAIKLLHRIGALEDEHLTALGTYLAMIPADLRCGKLLVYGSILSCLDSCLTIASILTTKSPFVSPRDKRDEAKDARSAFSEGHGDLLLGLAAYKEWDERSQFSRYRDVQDWCSSNFISQQTMRDIKSTRSQLLNSLMDAGLVPFDYPKHNSQHIKSLNTYSSNALLLRALIAGALNPQLAQISLPDTKYIASISGAKALDPEAKTIKYFNQDNGRVFVHPSSILFEAQSYTGNAMYVAYFTKLATSKVFIRDLTPFNAYSLLLFGGPIELDTSGLGLLVDGWLRLRGWARIGVLVSRLRALLDDALRRRIDRPTGMARAQDDERVFGIVRWLVELNGQDQ